MRFPCPRGLLHRSLRGLVIAGPVIAGPVIARAGAVTGGAGCVRGTSDPLRSVGSPAMPVRTPCPTAPSAAERVRLKKMAHGHRTGHRLRVRAQVVPHAARGRSNACVARETGLHLDAVRRRRGRFAQRACPDSKTVNAAAAPPRTHLRRPRRSGRRPAGCRRVRRLAATRRRAGRKGSPQDH